MDAVLDSGKLKDYVGVMDAFILCLAWGLAIFGVIATLIEWDEGRRMRREKREKAIKARASFVHRNSTAQASAQAPIAPRALRSVAKIVLWPFERIAWLMLCAPYPWPEKRTPP